ncbi:MAG: DUF11 domain-containing protein [Clostridiales bacterium]|nr:DUF11 domain-containing protein [Clostridiales bacterium]
MFPHADIIVVITAQPTVAVHLGVITYTIIVLNAGPCIAFGTVAECFPPDELCNLIYSSDGGFRWRPWRGYLRLGSLDPGTSVTILLTGTIHCRAARNIVNCVEAYSSTADIFPENNRAKVTVALNMC